MLKTFALIFTIIGLAAAGSGLKLSFSRDTATLARSGSLYHGLVPIDCTGGSGNYQFQITNLPSGWKSENNVISIPNIVNVKGDFILNVKVTDDAGNAFQGDLNLSVNGINIQASTSNASTSSSAQVNSGTQGNLVGSTISINTLLSNTNGTPNPQVASLYENYPGLKANESVTPASGVYPTSPPVTGPPLTPTITPSLIANAQVAYNSARDAKPITIDDVKRNAAFNRQLNANKAVANLIAIIQQLTANVNAAKNDVGIVQKSIASLQITNDECNSKVYDLSNTRSKIQAAITDKQAKAAQGNQQIANLAPFINDLNKVRDSLILKRNQVENTRSPNAVKLNDLERQVSNCTSVSDNLQKQIDDLKNQIEGYQADIRNTQADAASAPVSIDQIDQQIPIIDNKIANLKKQLEDAQKQKTKLLQDKQKYQQIVDDANKKVRDLQRRVDDLSSRIPSLQNQVTNQKSKCEGISRQIDDLRNQIAQKQSDYKLLVEQIKTQQGLINEKKDQSKQISDAVATATNENNALQKQLARVEEAIRRQYYICNDAAESIRKSRLDLQALINKYNTESVWLKDANLNLEKARAEKDLADIAVTEIISSSTNALPFAIIPNGNGQTPAGTPFGNNPSGSPLGPISEKNQVNPGSPVAVGDLTTYLSQAYGAGVDPARPSSATTLFPLSSLTLQAITGQSKSGVFNADGTFVSGGLTGVGGGKIPSSYLSSFSCNESAGVTQGEGQVASIQPGQIVVDQVNGGQITLKVAQCSKLNSVQNNYQIIPKTKVYFRGVQRSQGAWELHQLTCI